MDLKLPALGEGADSGTVVNLFVNEGDELVKDQPVLELENEKAVATIPSTAAGKVTKIFVTSGDKISIGQRILSLSETAATETPRAAKEKPVAKDQGAVPEHQEESKEAAPKEEAAEDKAPE